MVSLKKNFGSFKFNIILIYILIFSLISVGYVIYFEKRISNEFLYQNIAYVNLYLTKPHIESTYIGKGIFRFVDYIPCHVILLIEISKITGLDPRIIQYLPFGLILMISSYFLFIRKFSKSSLVACLMCLYITYETSHIMVLYSVFPYAFTIPLYLLFVYTYVKYLESMDNRYIIFTILLFTGDLYIHYSPAAWIIVFLIFVNVFTYLARKLKLVNLSRQSDGVHTTAVPLVIAFIIIYLIFNETFYKLYLGPIISVGTLRSAEALFLSKLSSYLFGTAKISVSEPYIYTFPGSVLLGKVAVIHLIIILIPIIIGIILDFKNYYVNTTSPIVWSMIFVGAFDVVSYTLRGNVSTKYISIVFPILSIYYIYKITEIKKFWYKYSYLLVLFLCIFIKLSLCFVYGYLGQESTNYMEISNPSNWLFQNVDSKEIAVISDLHTFGKFLVGGTNFDKILVLQYYTSEIYNLIVNPIYTYSENNLSKIAEFVLVDGKGLYNPIKSFWWKIYEPLSMHICRINMNVNLNEVYNSNNIIIYKTI